MCLSKDITIGIECTTLTQVVISSTATKNVAVNIAFKECHISLTSLVYTLQSTNAIVNACCFNDATSYSGNLTTAKECVTNVTAIHLDIAYIHTTVVDVATTEDTTAIEQAVRTIACPGLVVQLLLIVVRANLYVVEVGICCGNGIEVAIADESLVERDIGSAEDSATLTTAIGVTLNGGNTVDEAGSVGFTDNNVCFTEDVTCRGGIDISTVITHTAFPSTTIHVTGRTALDIGIGTGNERIVEVVSSHVVLVVHRTYSTRSIEVLGNLTTQQGDVGGSVHVTGIRSICVTQTATVGVSTATAAIVHVAADISTLIDTYIRVIFIGG